MLISYKAWYIWTLKYSSSSNNYLSSFRGIFLKINSCIKINASLQDVLSLILALTPFRAIQQLYHHQKTDVPII